MKQSEDVSLIGELDKFEAKIEAEVYAMVRAMVTWHKGDGIFWFRIRGWGIVIEDRTKKMMLFSERYGYTKWLRVGKWAIKTLRKINKN